MERRDFIKTTAGIAAVLVAQGHLPLFAADARNRKKGKKDKVSQNPFTEPCAIEPLTGYLPTFSPTAGVAMSGVFRARYSLVQCNGAAKQSRNSVGGTIDVTCLNGECRTTETRPSRPNTNVLKTSMTCVGELNTVSEWTMVSTLSGRKDLGFTEKGSWNGKKMTVKSGSWTQTHATSHPLIGRWAILPLVASGVFKRESFAFDMLDDSTLRPNQTIRFEGQIDVPVRGGTTRADSYVQTGQAIVPTHYLVDDKGRVQLITMSTVNWALAGPVK